MHDMRELLNTTTYRREWFESILVDLDSAKYFKSR